MDKGVVVDCSVVVEWKDLRQRGTTRSAVGDKGGRTSE